MSETNKLSFKKSLILSLGSQISACPSNMIYNPCICQATCADPNGQSGCNSDCLGSEDCICPDEFLMNGIYCIPASQCGCFLAEANLVIPVSKY